MPDSSTIQRIVEIVLKVTDQSRKGLQSFERSTRAVDQATRNTAEATKQTTASTRRLASAAHAAGSQLNQVASSSSKAQRQVSGLANSVKRAGTEFDTARTQARSFIAILAGGAGFGLATREAGKFSTAIAEVETLVDSSQTSNAQLRNSVLSLSNAYGTDAVQTARALYQAISAGAESGAESQHLLDVALRTAIGGVTEASIAVDGLTTVLNAWQKEFSDAEQVADVLFTTMRNGKTTIAELSQFMFQAAPIAAALGVSFEELSAAIIGLTLQGVPTRIAFTQIRAAIQGLSRDTPELIEIFQELGFESGEQAIKVNGLRFAFDTVAEAADGSLGALQKLVGSIEGSQGILGLTGQQASFFGEALERIDDSAGAADVAFQKVNASLGQELSKTLVQSKNALEALGVALEPVARTLLTTIQLVSTGITSFVETFPTLSKTVVTVGALAATMAGLALVIGKIGAALYTMSTALGGSAIAATGLTAAVGLLNGALAVTLNLARALFATPLGLILLGAVAALKGLEAVANKMEESLEETTTRTRELAEQAQGIRDLRDELVALGLATEDLDLQIEQLNADIFAGRISPEEAAAPLIELRDTAIRIKNEIAAEQRRLDTLEVQEAEFKKDELIRLQEETVRRQLTKERERVNAVKQSLREEERAIQESENRARDLRSRGADVRNSIQDRISDRARESMDVQEREADINAEIARRIIAARRELRNVRDAEHAESIQQEVERTAALTDRLENDKAAGLFLQQLASINARATNEGIKAERRRQNESRKTVQSLTAELRKAQAEVRKTTVFLAELGKEQTVSVAADIAEAEREIARLESELAALTQPRTVTVTVRTIQARQDGGEVFGAGAIRARTGTRLPGYGGGDRIPVLAEGGEFIIRKERARAFAGLLHMINSAPDRTLRNALSSMSVPRFAIGGEVPSVQTTTASPRFGRTSSGDSVRSSSTVKLDLTIGGNDLGSLFGARDTVQGLVDALEEVRKANAGT